jgi:hypothetical protein
MARDIEKLELLFRRQLAIESTKSPKRSATYRLDAVTSLGGNTGSAGVAEDCPPPYRFSRERPEHALVPSAGYFNAARVHPGAGTWLLVVGGTKAKRFAKLISVLLSVQSSKRTFLPIFVLDDSEHLELLRFYGFTFEVICDEAYSGTTREEQIELFKSKWGAALSIDLGSTHPDTFPAGN